MSFLVVEGSQSVREALCYVLLSFGIKGIPVHSREAAWEALDKAPDVEGLIIDIDNQEVQGAQLIEEIKAKESSARVSLIVHTVQSSKAFVLKMIEAGVAGYLLKPFSEDSARAKLAVILGRLKDHDTQRKHIRVKPDPQEMIRVHFRLPGTGSAPLVSGKLLDVSLGGIAIELLTAIPPESFPPGTKIPRLQFPLGPRELFPGATVVLAKAGVLALRFDALSVQDKTALERYIFKRISS